MRSTGCCRSVSFLATLVLYGVSFWIKTKSVMAWIFLAVLLGIFTQGLTEYNMGNSAVMKLYWLLLGLCLQWMRLEKALP